MQILPGLYRYTPVYYNWGDERRVYRGCVGFTTKDSHPQKLHEGVRKTTCNKETRSEIREWKQWNLVWTEGSRRAKNTSESVWENKRTNCGCDLFSSRVPIFGDGKSLGKLLYWDVLLVLRINGLWPLLNGRLVLRPGYVGEITQLTITIVTITSSRTS